MELPNCPSCKKAQMVPLSDEGRGGGSMPYKAWVCLEVDCGHSVRIDSGKVTRTFDTPNTDED